MQTRDETMRNCLEFSQPLSCLYQAMQTRKTFSIAFINNIPKRKRKTLEYGTDKKRNSY